ncbi:hypothetical protein [Streptomyces antimycoticus]|uniref:hypothetical protein n=1 Tax=Streptomyces antimycoticus TaxID=68175 RepID=UPI0011808F9C|nr:hypothetical protein [Streptomyces antimycoticus]
MAGLTSLGRAQLEQAIIGQASLEEEFFARISRVEQRGLAQCREYLTDEQLDMKELFFLLASIKNKLKSTC